MAAVTGWLVREARPHGGDGAAGPGMAAPQGGHQEARGSWEWGRRHQPLQGSSKGRSSMGETEVRAMRAARAAGKRFMQPAAAGHRQSHRRSPQAVTHTRTRVTHAGASTHVQGER